MTYEYLAMSYLQSDDTNKLRRTWFDELNRKKFRFEPLPIVFTLEKFFVDHFNVRAEGFVFKLYYFLKVKLTNMKL